MMASLPNWLDSVQCFKEQSVSIIWLFWSIISLKSFGEGTRMLVILVKEIIHIGEYGWQAHW